MSKDLTRAKIVISSHARKRLAERMPHIPASTYPAIVSSARYKGLYFDYIVKVYPELARYIAAKTDTHSTSVRLYDGAIFIFKGGNHHARILVTVLNLPNVYINGLADRKVPRKIGSDKLYQRVEKKGKENNENKENFS